MKQAVVRLLYISLLYTACSDSVGLVVDYPEVNELDSEQNDTFDTASDIAVLIDTDTASFDMPFLLGADISFVQEQEDKGVIFTDNGEEGDILDILKSYGFNAIRLRIFHDPGQPNGYQFAWAQRTEPYCDLVHTVQMAHRIKKADMYFMLNFHYSDTWADPGSQIKPALWSELSFVELTAALYEYTRDVLSAFRAEGCLPNLVQLGNEITAGILFPDGQTYPSDNWEKPAELLISAARAVRDVDPGIRIVLHLDKGGDNEATVWWLEEALSRGIDFDILAQSAYTRWQGGPESWRANFSALAEQYPDLSFLIAEYSDKHEEVNDIMLSTPRGLGSFVWEPTADGEWGQGLFEMPTGQGLAYPRETLSIFKQIANEANLR